MIWNGSGCRMCLVAIKSRWVGREVPPYLTSLIFHPGSRSSGNRTGYIIHVRLDRATSCTLGTLYQATMKEDRRGIDSRFMSIPILLMINKKSCHLVTSLRNFDLIAHTRIALNIHRDAELDAIGTISASCIGTSLGNAGSSLSQLICPLRVCLSASATRHHVSTGWPASYATTQTRLHHKQFCRASCRLALT